MTTAVDHADDPSKSLALLLPPQICAFPPSRFQELRAEHGPGGVKLVHMLRHAEGTHNVKREYNNSVHADARLTHRGVEQCMRLAASLESEHPRLFDGKSSSGDGSAGVAVVTSPMTRCIQTAMQSFPGLVAADVPFVAHEGFRETVNYHCDRRRTVAELSAEYGKVVDFALLARDNVDPIWERYRQRLPPGWDRHMESADLASVVARARDGLSYVARRPEPEIVICTHSAFLRCIMNHGQKGGIPQRPPQDLAASFVVPHGVKKNDSTLTSSSGGVCSGKEAGENRDDGRAMVHKMFEYDNADGGVFEKYMRRNYENCELRSFCLLFSPPSSPPSSRC